jgi:hypothetical protein
VELLVESTVVYWAGLKGELMEENLEELKVVFLEVCMGGILEESSVV